MQISSNSFFKALPSVEKIDDKKAEGTVADNEVKDSKKVSEAPQNLSPGEKQQLHELQARDMEVRTHESAHQAASGGMAGSASFSYQRGPDGKMYAVGGEVPISMKSGSTPEETIANARQVAAAAMAPANPSPQDYAVASSARVMEMKAQQQLSRELAEQKRGEAVYTASMDEKNQELPFESM